jgi:hypothetical protein
MVLANSLDFLGWNCGLLKTHQRADDLTDFCLPAPRKELSDRSISCRDGSDIPRGAVVGNALFEPNF